MLNQDRLSRLQSLVRESGCAMLAVMPNTNLFYLCGFRMGLSERSTLAFIPAQGEPAFLAPLLEAEKVKKETGVANVEAYADEEGPWGAAARLLGPRGLAGQRIGVENRYMRVQELSILERAVGSFERFDAGPLFDGLRVTKDAEETVLLARAAEIASHAAAAVRQALRPGVSEGHLAAVAEKAAKDEGGSDLTIYSLIASGPRSAFPHSGTSDRVVQQGETVWADIVVTYRGYVGDITRTWPVGTIDPELARAYEVVFEAQKAARLGARPGLSGADVDAICRSHIEAHGFGPYFTHRTGHGLGIEVHEEPYIVKSNHEPLRPGMAFTIEPGIYLPGKGGVRIEDDAVVTPTGVRILTTERRHWLREGVSES